MSSTSPTKVSPAAPPRATAAIFWPVVNFSCFAFFKPFCKFFAFGFKYVPAFLARKAFNAAFLASVAAAVAGVAPSAILTTVKVSAYLRYSCAA